MDMNVNIVNEIINQIRECHSTFDSHLFIREMIKIQPVLYGELLIRHGNVNIAHSEISRFLGNHSKELGIVRIGDVDSETILSSMERCANWGFSDN